MLSEDQLLDRFVLHRVPLTGRKIVKAIRQGDPSRRVGGGKLNVVCRYASRKMGCVIQAESHKNELANVYLWDHDSETDEFYDQPPQIKLKYRNAADRNCAHLSTPDYFLIQKHWMGWVECKTEEELLKREASGSELYVRQPDGRWHCSAGEAYAAQYGLEFRVISSKEIDWLLVRNFNFLSDYLDVGCSAPSAGQIQRIRAAFTGTRWLSLQSLLARADIDADAVYKMVADGMLFVDLHQELLAEPQYTSVCADVTSLMAYQGHKKLRSTTTLPDIRSVELKAGTPFLWDGQPWRIGNVGLTELFVVAQNYNKTFSTLPHEAFQSLVAQGAITGQEKSVADYQRRAEEVLKQAAPVDLEEANKRYLALVDPNTSTIPARTLRAWRAKQRGGEMAYGNGYVGLLPRISARGNRRRKVPARVIQLMEAAINQHVLSPDRSLISIAYGHLVNCCKEEGLQAPSEKTFSKEIKRCTEEALKRAREGEKAAYNLSEFHWLLDQSTPRHGERPFEVGHIDHTEIDLQLCDSRTGANLGKAWLTILIDAYSRMILGFYLTFDPPSYRSCMAVIRDALKRHQRIPKTIVVDHGKDFESAYFEALLARLETHKKSRPPSKSRFGSVIERFFGVANQRLIHNLAGNNQALQSPRSMSASHDPRKLAVWTLSAFTTLFERFLDEVYANLVHPALGLSPREMLARGLALFGHRPHMLIPYTPDLVLQCLPSTRTGKAMVRQGRGIKIRGILYWHAAFRYALVVGRSVSVRYDPFDISRAHAYVNGEWLLCRSEYTALFERRTEAEIRVVTQEIRAHHALYGIRRRVNGADVAAFVVQEKANEAILRQQRRDAERHTDEADADVSAPQLPPPENAPQPTFEDQWASVEFSFENFGELK